MGTPLYMSPEQVRNERTIGPGADIYALGHIAYTLLSGESYWSQESDDIPSPYLLVAEIMRGTHEPATVRAMRRRGVMLPAALDAWFFRVTDLSAEARFSRATEAIFALADALSVHLPKPSPVLFDPMATNPVGDEPASVPGSQTTRELYSSSIGEMPIGTGSDTPTVVTDHTRSELEGSATMPVDTVVRSTGWTPHHLGGGAQLCADLLEVVRAHPAAGGASARGDGRCVEGSGLPGQAAQRPAPGSICKAALWRGPARAPDGSPRARDRAERWPGPPRTDDAEPGSLDAAEHRPASSPVSAARQARLEHPGAASALELERPQGDVDLERQLEPQLGHWPSRADTDICLGARQGLAHEAEPPARPGQERSPSSQHRRPRRASFRL